MYKTSLERVIHAPDEVTDLDALAAEAIAHKFIIYAIQVPSQFPYWTEAYAIEDRTSHEWLGIVGKLGMSQTFEYTNMCSRHDGRGRAKGREAAVVALAKAAGIAPFG